jgi:fructose-1-phosphate kinase PfkB-like protein
MIRVVGANPAMDRVSTWAPVRLGEVNRATSVSVMPGGKGFNVARAAVRLGSQAVAYGFLGGPVGAALRAMIIADGVVDRHTDIAAGTRVCFIVVEPEAERTTVLNEPGPAVTEEETARLLAGLREDCRPGDLLLISGSLPDSVDAGVARDIVAVGKKAGARTLLDIHGASLRAAAEAQPWMVKCNPNPESTGGGRQVRLVRTGAPAGAASRLLPGVLSRPEGQEPDDPA